MSSYTYVHMRTCICFGFCTCKSKYIYICIHECIIMYVPLHVYLYYIYIYIDVHLYIYIPKGPLLYLPEPRTECLSCGLVVARRHRHDRHRSDTESPKKEELGFPESSASVAFAESLIELYLGGPCCWFLKVFSSGASGPAVQMWRTVSIAYAMN